MWKQYLWRNKAEKLGLHATLSSKESMGDLNPETGFLLIQKDVPTCSIKYIGMLYSWLNEFDKSDNEGGDDRLPDFSTREIKCKCDPETGEPLPPLSLQGMIVNNTFAL